MASPDSDMDTIVAQATPPGRGGISIVRVSGPLVQSIMPAILQRALTPREATYLTFFAADNEPIDEGIALFFPNPHSFTGEDVLELHGHGGPFVVDLLLQRLLALGARLAQPGEFSLRAFLNGKLDLTQAEAIADLIDASSTQAARLALRSLQGDFSRAIHAINEKIIELRLYIEAAIDFVDEEIDFLSDGKIIDRLKAVITALANLKDNAKQGSLLREGITAVIVGAPNVGKSSLLNCLSGKDLAIVTNVPGTTRDVLRDYILLDDIPMHIVDTAGIRESDDVVEIEGIRRAYLEIEKADIILYLQDATNPTLTLETRAQQHAIIVRNKIDLVNESPMLQIEDGQVVISLSAKTGVGIQLLKDHIKQKIGVAQQDQGIYLARRRHLDALAKAAAHLDASLLQLTTSGSYELAAEDLRLAHRALTDITGEFTADDLLGRIFSSFCIGK